jgi:hypothetical protein
MNKFLVFGLALLASLVAGDRAAEANSPTLKGTWLVTASLEPGRNFGGTVCFVFTRTNAVLGVTRYSGTWEVPDEPGGGQWVQLGDLVYWWGTVGDVAGLALTGNLETRKVMGGVTLAQFDLATGNASAVGSFTAKKTNCASSKSEAQSAPGFAPGD